ncbi:hypothetical protein K458DRAFT_492907 [Lentithecium fluviatile CBS 122367]|uniref:Uncharacterized protein n=1 Tax=Lentithecium fluviatile CBS 122367 TaxID=1168545 RepID=A0A6G1IC01_9PLEO|nr:hypothetical protein K458DRAFT_492907 [Lentithecium fluviatile CBS 122367]
MKLSFVSALTLTNLLFSYLVSGLPSPFSLASPLFPRGDEAEWKKSVARGEKLLRGMKADDDEAVRLWDPTGNLKTIQSWLDGECEDNFKEWGYSDDTEQMRKEVDKYCSFDNMNVGDVFKYLGIADRKSWKNVTAAGFTIGVNPKSGTVSFVNRKSPQAQVKALWGRDPTASELPYIQSSSDVAWCFWNRAMKDPGGGDLQNIRHFMATNTVNAETNRLIRRAMKELGKRWPGEEFSMDTDEGKALLGSPNGWSAGYFLMQHKEQLGGNKYTDKVQVFFVSLPWVVFYVKGPDAAPDAAPENMAGIGNGTEDEWIQILAEKYAKMA